MKLEFGIGTSTQAVEVPDENLLGVLHANAAPAIESEDAEIRRALREPIASPRLAEIPSKSSERPRPTCTESTSATQPGVRLPDRRLKTNLPPR